MGLLKAGAGALGGVLADSWRDYFYCDALNADTLVVKGTKRTSDKGRSSNTKGESNIISDGSIIAVADGQYMIIVEQGAIVDACGEPGEFVFDNSSEPSLFFGDDKITDRIKTAFERVGGRFTFGGRARAKTSACITSTRKRSSATSTARQRPVPFGVVDANIGLDVDHFSTLQRRVLLQDHRPAAVLQERVRQR